MAGVPTLLLSLGGAKPAPPGVPKAEIAAIPGATGFDALPICTEAGFQILRAEGEDPALCGASRGERAKAHAAIARRIRDFLAERIGWQPGPGGSEN